MTNKLTLLFTRVDALSLRERVFVFLSVLACCAAVVDTLWLSPAQTAHKQLTQRFEKQSAELQRLRDTLKTVARPVETGQALREESATLTSRLAQADQAITALVPVADAQGTPLTQALVHLLRRHEGLTLLRTVALQPVAPAAKETPVPHEMRLGRQGVEIKVAGPYADLTRYVQTLERSLPQLRWGSMSLTSDKGPPELTLQLFVLEVLP